MKLISKEHPLSYLLILVFELIAGILLCIGGLAIDLSIYDPPEDVPSFPIPLFMMFAMAITACVMLISAIIIIIRIIYLYCKNNKK